MQIIHLNSNERETHVWMSDEWIVQFGGVFVELQEIREKEMSKKGPQNDLVYLHANVSFNNNSSLSQKKHTISICNY